MNTEMQELYNSIVNMNEMEEFLKPEFLQLEKEHINFNDIILNRQADLLLPGDTAILLTKFEDEEDYRYYDVVKTKKGYGLKEINGKLVHQQEEKYDYEQTITL